MPDNKACGGIATLSAYTQARFTTPAAQGYISEDVRLYHLREQGILARAINVKPKTAKIGTYVDIEPVPFNDGFIP